MAKPKPTASSTWRMSALPAVGLSPLRKRRRKGAGAMLVAGLVGLSLVRRKV